MKELILTALAFFVLASSLWVIGLRNIYYNSKGIDKAGRRKRSTGSMLWKERRIRELKLAQA
jgi:hypothetical protein